MQNQLLFFFQQIAMINSIYVCIKVSAWFYIQFCDTFLCSLSLTMWMAWMCICKCMGGKKKKKLFILVDLYYFNLSFSSITFWLNILLSGAIHLYHHEICSQTERKIASELCRNHFLSTFLQMLGRLFCNPTNIVSCSNALPISEYSTVKAWSFAACF